MDQRIAFGMFQFDTRSGQLWRSGTEVKLTPRAASVLRALTVRSQEVVTKQELFDSVWGGSAVGDDALTSCIQELRNALGDNARRPTILETRHRRGYRLMLPAEPVPARIEISQRLATGPERSRLVGRAMELAELTRRFEEASLGERQIVFLSGEAGIGKTALADAFLEELAGADATRIALGQCLDHHGAGEPYLPLIEALTRLAQATNGSSVKEILSAQAPSWLAQMPSLWNRAERRALEGRSPPTRERMMRELTHALEAIASDTPLVLRVEDIHWSDESTLDWIGQVARRPEAARLMVLATFRPADAAAAKGGIDRLVAELELHGLCREIALPPLGLDAVESYLNIRLGDDDAEWRRLALLLLERTGGNPLFIASIVREFAQDRAVGRTLTAMRSVPHDVRRFIERQINDLAEEDRDLLMAASVVGREFAAAAVASALDRQIDVIEIGCMRLARRGVFIGKSGSEAGSVTWPDGTRSETYWFRHDLYRELLYENLPATRRALCHSRTGRRIESAWSCALDAVAAEVADHYERGHEAVRAIPHHHRAAASALRRSANAEAIRHLQQALNGATKISDDVERGRIEFKLLVNLGAAFIATRGFSAAEVAEIYARAEALCDRLGEGADIFPALWGQWMFRWGRSEIDAAWLLCERLQALADRSGDTGLKLQAHHAAWATLFGLGMLADACAHADAGLALYDATIHQPMASSYGNHDAGNCARYFKALALALVGDDDNARSMADYAVTVAKQLNDPFSLALSLYFGAAAAQILGDTAVAAERSKASYELAVEHNLAMPKAWSTGVLGWCAAEDGEPERGAALLNEAIAALEATRSRHFMPYLLGLLAHVRFRLGQLTEAMKAVEKGIALSEGGGERFYSAELHRLKGELLASTMGDCRLEAKRSFGTAIEIARKQGAASLEAKASASLDRWRQLN
ncbi:MAG TPA: AAA family ATPase [Xanthobacteraceae bacterium]|nr:AAA family ATPase [Xanthobacteraceae bacterium]